jgi:hypothetical protein
MGHYHPGMADTYVVVAEVSGFGDDDEEDKLAFLQAHTTFLEALIRDDGTGEAVFLWEPDEEADGTRSFTAAEPSLEHVRSALQGAGLPPTNPLRVEMRDVKAKKASAKKK